MQRPQTAEMGVSAVSRGANQMANKSVSSLDESDTPQEITLKSKQLADIEKIQARTEQLSKLEKHKRALQAGQKEHTQSKLIQDLNKEIEFHDKVIDVLREMVTDRGALDESIMLALQGQIPLQRPFYLREELLEKVKAEKKKYVSFKEKFTREAEAVKNRKFESKCVDATGAVLDTLDLADSLADMVKLAKKMGNKNSEMEALMAKLQAEVDKNQIEMDTLKSKLASLTQENQGVDTLQQNYGLQLSEFKQLGIELGSIKQENHRLQELWDATSSKQSAESTNLITKIEALEKELQVCLAENSKKEQNLLVKAEVLDQKQEGKANEQRMQEELTRLELWNKRKQEHVVSQREAALQAEQKVNAERERLENAKNKLAVVRQEVEQEGRPI